LSLLMLGIRAKDTQHSFTPYNLAIAAHFFYGCSNFHNSSSSNFMSSPGVAQRNPGNNI
jgi:hypothetical protein